jgi:hypothetical protein
LEITAVAGECIYKCTVTIQTETSCNIDQALTLSFPILKIATVTSKNIYLALKIAIQTETGCKIDQALTLAIPVLEVTAITA